MAGIIDEYYFIAQNKTIPNSEGLVLSSLFINVSITASETSLNETVLMRKSYILACVAQKLYRRNSKGYNENYFNLF